MKLGIIGKLFPLMFSKVVYGYTAKAVPEQREHPMDWVFDFSYDLSVPEYYVTHRECGVCKIGLQEGLTFLTPHMCVMDYPTIEYKGGKLIRTKTLSTGGDCCDFHVVKGDQ